MSELLDFEDWKPAVSEALQFSFIPIPLVAKEKVPKINSWQNRELEHGDKGFSGNDNVGILTGSKSGIFVVDVDNKEGGIETYKSWIQQYGEFHTPLVRTGSGGYHIYFKYEDKVAGIKSSSKVLNDKSGKPIGIDIKTNGGYVVYPGSIHPNGNRYEWINHPDNYDLMSCPDWLIELLTVKSKKNKSILIGDPNKPIEEVSQEVINRAWQTFMDIVPNPKDFSIRDIKNNMILLNRVAKPSADCLICKESENGVERHGHGKSDKKGDNPYISIEGKDQKVFFYCRRASTEQKYLLDQLNPINDTGFYNKICLKGEVGPAEVYAEHRRDVVKVISHKGPVFIWDEKKCIWIEKPVIAISTTLDKVLVPLVEDKIKELKKELERTNDKTFQTMITNYEKEIKRLQTLSHAKNITSYICDYLSEPSFTEKLDSKSKLLPIRDKKILNLETGEIRQRTKDDYFTYELEVNYTGRISDGFKQFLQDIFLNDHEMIDYMGRVFGYSLTGTLSEQKLFILTGNGQNGKSTLMNLVLETLKGLAVVGSKTLINGKRNNNGPSSDLVRFIGKRLVSFPEPSDSEKLNESEIKCATGGESIVCRRNYQDEFSYRPFFTPFMLTNNIPLCSGNHAILRRLVIIEFKASFVENPDPNLTNERKLDVNMIGKMIHSNEFKESCLSWMIQGALQYFKIGLKSPPSVVIAVDEYRQETDLIQRFLEDHCSYDPSFEIRSSNLFNSYCEYCEHLKIKPQSMQSFFKSKSFKDICYSKNVIKKRKNDGMYYIGIATHDI